MGALDVALGRIDHFDTVIKKSRLAPPVQEVAIRLLDSMKWALDVRNEYEEVPENFARQNLDPQIDMLRNVMRSPTNVQVLDWVRFAATEQANSSEWYQTSDLQFVNMLASLTAEFRTVAERANLLMDEFSLQDEREQLLEEARRSAEQAASAAEKAQESAGVTGSSSLSLHFSTYAKSERRAAEVFRGLSILAVIGALVAALAYGSVDPGNWTQLTYRVATVAAVGTLAAYFARQAGQHRRIYNWAKSLEVQLKSFPAFIEPIPDAERIEVYRSFARRVLSAPPEKGTENNEDTVGAAQLLDLVTALAKRVN